jgi:hypothetical protein
MMVTIMVHAAAVVTKQTPLGAVAFRCLQHAQLHTQQQDTPQKTNTHEEKHPLDRTNAWPGCAAASCQRHVRQLSYLQIKS